MLLEPDEREQVPDRLRARLRDQGTTGSFDLIAAHDDRLAGWLPQLWPEQGRPAQARCESYGSVVLPALLWWVLSPP